MKIYVAPVRTAITSATLASLLAIFFFSACRPKTDSLMPAPVTATEAVVDPWKEAALRVEQDRGEPMGREAEVEVPSQLKHFGDSRRFLGSQIAEARKQQLKTPADFGDMVILIEQGELVELPPLGKGYILYGVGMLVSDEPLTHYDKATRQSVTLFGNDAELQREYRLISESHQRFKEELTRLREQLRQTPKRDREVRERLQSEAKDKNKSLTEFTQRKKLLDSFYRSLRSRGSLFAEYGKIAALARNFGGRSYDLNDSDDRKAFKVKLLSYLRPAAMNVLEELGQAYQNKFARPLPVTSLIRSDEYQRQLRENNPNATLIAVPPHTTGLAFDLYYRFMSASEQEFVMAELARMRDAGRVEALREQRNHFHVFAFVEGRPPDEKMIKNSLDRVSPTVTKKQVGAPK